MTLRQHAVAYMTIWSAVGLVGGALAFCLAAMVRSVRSVVCSFRLTLHFDLLGFEELKFWWEYAVDRILHIELAWEVVRLVASPFARLPV